MLVKRQVTRVSLGAGLGLLVLCAACGDDGGGSVLMPPDGCHLRYYDAGVGSPDASDLPPLEDGDMLYSVNPFGDRHSVSVMLWPPPDAGCTRFLEVDALVAGRSVLLSGIDGVCEVDTIGVDTVHFTCNFGMNLGFEILTFTGDTSVIYDFSYRVCCRDGGCLAWTDPISFTVIDTLSR